jgi:hypothetical protein
MNLSEPCNIFIEFNYILNYFTSKLVRTINPLPVKFDIAFLMFIGPYPGRTWNN